MKVTVVPAQVTTVEDRIIGSLTLSQMAFIMLPIFISAGLYAGLPPFMSGNMYKYLLITFITAISLTLAIRIKGEIIGKWLVILASYYTRPMYYLFDKNTLVHRHDYSLRYEEPKIKPTDQLTVNRLLTERNLSIAEMSRVLDMVDDPNANVRFETSKKGGLYVRLAEIKK